MIHNYYLSSKNIEIKPLGEEDIEFLRKWRNDKDNSAFLSDIPYITEKMQQEWYAGYLEDEKSLYFSIIMTDDIQQIIGSLSIYNIDSAARTADIGKIVIGDKNARGHSYGKIAMELAIKVAFESLMLKELHLNVHTDNIAALKTYEALGFTKTGQHPFEKGGYEYEMVLYSEGR